MPSANRQYGNETLGIGMILATLAVIAVTVGVLINTQTGERAAEMRARGVNLARLLSEVPYAQVLHAPRRNVLHLLFESGANPDLAYGMVSDADGTPVSQVAAAGVLIPPAAPGARPSDWAGERDMRTGDGRDVIEFYAPMLEDGVLAGQVRLGYFPPSLGPTREQVSLFATISLPIFLLTPLFYFLVRREVRPLRQANTEFRTLMERQALQPVTIEASGELGEFIARFNEFVTMARERIDTLEGEQTRLVTSTKLLGYQRMRVETVLQTFPEAIMVLDDSGTPNYANPRVAHVFDLPLAEIVGHKLQAWCKDPALLAYLQRFRTRSASRYGPDSIALTLAHSPEKSLQVKGYPLFSPREPNQILGTLVVFRDVTEEMLARRSRGEFVAHVAHELKTPLNVMAMYGEALQGEDGKNEELRIEAVNVLNDEVARLSMLINNLLSITKIEMGSLGVEKQRVKLRELLQDAFDTVARSGREHSLEFHFEVPRELSAVSVDKDLLRISINNLLTNAIKYSEPGGKVTLAAEEQDAEILISISDEGIGIAEHDRELIFDKFFRSESAAVRSRTGHGLGLSLAREIVQLHHGELRVESEPGQGSTFTIVLKKDAALLRSAV